MTALQRIWLHLFGGGELSDRGAMVKYGYGAFRSRVAEKRDEYHILDRWEELEIGGSKVRFKVYFIDPVFLQSEEAQRIRGSLKVASRESA